MATEPTPQRAQETLRTLRDWLRYAVSRFNAAGVEFGHGCANAYDEAAYLVLHQLHLPLDRLEPFLDARLLPAECLRVADLIDRRVAERLPAAYLTGEAWLGSYRFRSDSRAIVPRSYLAELIEERFEPWISDADSVGSVLDLCTGSACLAIMLAHAFPQASVDAVDSSAKALELAGENLADYRLADRVRLIESDLYAALGGRVYDLIVANPPYVTDAAMATLPAEYRHEPSLALAGGVDGMDIVRRIVAGAGAHLNPDGVLVVEVGHNRQFAERAFAELPLVWLESRSGDMATFVVDASKLAAATRTTPCT